MRPLYMLIGIVSGAGAGVAANLLLGDRPELGKVIEYGTQPVGQIFLRLLFMLIVPLLFSALVVGVCELDLGHLGRLGGKMLAYTVVVSAIAVVIGMVLVNVVRPGDRAPRALREQAREAARVNKVEAAPTPKGGALAVIVQMVPDNPVKAAANGDMIGLLVFSLIFGAGLSVTRSPGAQRLREAIQGLYDVSMKLVGGVLYLAPFAVGALLFTMTARLGVDVLRPLLVYVAVVVGGLALHMFVVYPLSIHLLGRRDPVQFFVDSRVAIATAFATASSSATLPTALKVAEENLRLPSHVSRFVLTAGSAMNQNGTALFEGVTVLFLAQLYDVPLSFAQQAGVMGICILAGIGTAGVPAGSLPVVAMILGLFGIPVEGLALILGVDRFLDMCRTTLNVTGDLAAAVVVARGEEGRVGRTEESGGGGGGQLGP